MNGFKFDFSKIFWGGAHRAPSPDPSPAFSWASPSVRALPSILGRFGTLDSGFALDTRARPRFRLRPQLSIGDLGLAPPKIKFLDPPLYEFLNTPARGSGRGRVTIFPDFGGSGMVQSCPRVTFLWTRPDPTRRNVDPTRPAIADKKSDPTRPDPRPDPSPICIVFN